MALKITFPYEPCPSTFSSSNWEGSAFSKPSFTWWLMSISFTIPSSCKGNNKKQNPQIRAVILRKHAVYENLIFCDATIMHEILKKETNACPNFPRGCYWLGKVTSWHPGLLLLFIYPQDTTRYRICKLKHKNMPITDLASRVAHTQICTVEAPAHLF